MGNHSGYFRDNEGTEQFQAALNKAESLDHARRSAIDELRRWQDHDDIDMVRLAIDNAIRTLERG